MNLQASFRGNFSPLSSQCCSSCCDLRFFPLIASSVTAHQKWSNLRPNRASRLMFHGKREVVCKVTETETEPDSNNDKEKGAHEDKKMTASNESVSPVIDQNKDQFGTGMLDSNNLVNENGAKTKAQGVAEDHDNVEVASGSPLPGLKEKWHQQAQQLAVVGVCFVIDNANMGKKRLWEYQSRRTIRGSYTFYVLMANAISLPGGLVILLMK